MTETFPPIIRPPNYIATWEESRWLTGSSVWFLAPAIYAFFLDHYYHSTMLVAASLISINYWRKANESWRRKADLVFSKITFATFVVTGLLYIDGQIVYLCYLLFGVLVCSFLYSQKIYDVHNPKWVNYHMLFHLCLTIELFIIIHHL